jgi:hypothetical protein
MLGGQSAGYFRVSMRAQHVGKQLGLPRVEADPCAPVWQFTGGMNNRVDHSRGRTASEAQLLRGHQGRLDR